MPTCTPNHQRKLDELIELLAERVPIYGASYKDVLVDKFHNSYRLLPVTLARVLLMIKDNKLGWYGVNFNEDFIDLQVDPLAFMGTQPLHAEEKKCEHDFSYIHGDSCGNCGKAKEEPVEEFLPPPTKTLAEDDSCTKCKKACDATDTISFGDLLRDAGVPNEVIHEMDQADGMPATPPEKLTNEEIVGSCFCLDENHYGTDWENIRLNFIAALDAKDREREEAVREQIVKDINLAKNADDYGDEGITRHAIVESLRDQLTPTQE